MARLYCRPNGTETGELKALTGKRHDAPEALGAVVGDGGGG